MYLTASAWIAYYCLVFHYLKMLFANGRYIARDRDEKVSDLCCFSHRHDPVSIHHSFKSLPRLDIAPPNPPPHPAPPGPPPPPPPSRILPPQRSCLQKGYWSRS